MDPRHSLIRRTLRLAVIRIALVAIGASVASYLLNRASMEDALRAQLLLSTEQTIQRESLPFREIRELEQNFLHEFQRLDSDPRQRSARVHDFDQIFYRHDDGSYTQRPGLFEGQPLPDGRRFANMSATYAPEHPLSADVKARFALSYLLSHKYGSTTQGRLFNFYGVLPEKGFPIYQTADIAKAFTYSGPEALELGSYEFYARGFAADNDRTFLTRMYFDYSNNAWMTTVATPDTPDAHGKHRILACVDVLLDELMQRLAHPSIEGAYSSLFLADEDGTLMFHPEQMEAIKSSEGKASIKSLNLESMLPLLRAGREMVPGKVSLVDNADEIVAVGRLPETSAILSIHYPRALMRPGIVQNLTIVIALGLITLLVEAFLLRSILRKQVAEPLQKLMHATRAVGETVHQYYDLPTQSKDEIGELARDFTQMAERVSHTHERLETMVAERTKALEAANRKLAMLTVTDGLTGIANRRCFDEVLIEEWQRAKRTSAYLMLAMLDVDWFKSYNDHYGHQAGDDCLRAVAQAVQQHCNRAGDLLARYGGEEFIVISPTTNAAGALGFAQSICAAVQQLQLPHEASPLGIVTISVGVAGMVPLDGTDPAILLKTADAALYRAKASGRNQAASA